MAFFAWLLQADPTQPATGTVERWGAIMLLLTGVITLAGVIVRQGRHLMVALREVEKRSDFVEHQMAANGEARANGTDGKTIREAIDTYEQNNQLRHLANDDRLTRIEVHLGLAEDRRRDARRPRLDTPTDD